MEKLKYILDIQTFAEDPEQDEQEEHEEQEEQEENSPNRLKAQIDLLNEELGKLKSDYEKLDKRNRELEKTNIKLTQQGNRGSDSNSEDEDPFFTSLKNFLK